MESVKKTDVSPYILGIDLGVNSLGWAAIACGDGGRPTGFLTPPVAMPTSPTLGIRIFEEGVENWGKGEREVGRGQKRRMARLQRRQVLRRARRQAKCFRILQEAGLLPRPDRQPTEPKRARHEIRDAVLKELDAKLSQALAESEPEPARRTILLQHAPYALRKQALDRPLTAFELGRVFYQLAQRRGFLSNRKALDSDDERGKVKAGISELHEAMRQRGSRTLGEHLFEEAVAGRRIRRRWTARAMFHGEFESIWQAQERHHPTLLTQRLKRALHRALFHQRPLKSQRNLIGLCELENGDEYVLPRTGELWVSARKRRAPEGLLVSQKFRMLQKVNDLAILDTATGASRALTEDEHRSVVARLQTIERMSFAELKKFLELPPRKTKFNLEAGGEKHIPGNRTNAQMLAIFGERWSKLNAAQQDAAVLEVWSATDDAALTKRASDTTRASVWRALETTLGEAQDLPELRLGSDYMSLSKSAMGKLIPLLERRLQYSDAVREAYGERLKRNALDSLPPVEDALGSLRNPAVARALTELRRVVNLLVRRYGKPDAIHIELARDLKRGRDERNRIIKANRDREQEREKHAARIITDAQIPNPRPSDILKVRLWDECGAVCPYTGRSIGFHQLFGLDVDVEHIVPFSKSLDDSYLNKTLCFADANRQRKKNQTPFEAFAHAKEQWDDMVRRMEVNVASHGMPRAKLERFLLEGKAYEKYLQDFSSSQLNDTRYASTRAKEYLANLYGGNVVQGVDEAGARRVFVSNGQATALVRRALGLDRILKQTYGPDKRADHRHHAIDALVVALTGPSMVKQLSTLAQQSMPDERRPFRDLPAPWPSFESDVLQCLATVVISFRVDNRVRGALHKETIYSSPRSQDGKQLATGEFSHVRIHLSAKTTVDDVDAVVDPKVREILKAYFANRETAKLFDALRPATCPQLPTKTGATIPIMRVRVRKNNSTIAVGPREHARHVETGDNHHMLVQRIETLKGASRVKFNIVALLVAASRTRKKLPVYQADDNTVAVLRRNDVIAMSAENGGATLWRIRGLTDGVIQICPLTDARTKDEQTKAGTFRRLSASAFIKLSCSRVEVSPIGVLHSCRG